jgi:thioredoxin-like negative regulator of GroEL
MCCAGSRETDIMSKASTPLFLLLLTVVVLVVLLTGTSCSGGGERLPTLVFFRSDACPYCKQMTPVVDEIRRAHRGQLEVVYATLEEQRGKELADQYGIVGYPVILLLDSDGERVSRMQGVVPQPALEQAVENLMRPES